MNRSVRAQAQPTSEAIRLALTPGFTTAFDVGALMALTGFVLVLLVIRVRPQVPGAVAGCRAA